MSTNQAVSTALSCELKPDTNVLGTNNIKNHSLASLAASTLGSQHQDLEEMSKRTAKQHKKWLRRLKLLFCCLGYKKNKDSIADVASIFAEFYADLDVPSTDIAAGFVLLSKYQAAQRKWIVENQQSDVEQYLSSVPITRKTNFLDISSAEDSHLINDLIYYMNYSLAIFGWPMQMIDDPCMLCCICPYLRLSPCCSSRNNSPKRINSTSDKTKSDKSKGNTGTSSEIGEQNIDSTKTHIGASIQSIPGKLNDDCDTPIILEDNCCSCNVASVERRLSSHNYEIIFVSYKVDINIVPFLVAADHSKQSVVVAIRGSMSLSDMITDMNGQTDKIPIENCPDMWLCHRGITRAASYVKSKLEEERILDRAFSCRPDLGSLNYKLVLCGHSLGAGVAAILGILMRPTYTNLKAYLYSPPGGILSQPAVEYTKEFSIGILLGNDCVPRLGVAQLERLRYHVLLSLKSSQKSAGKIIAKALCPSSCIGTNKVDYDPSQSLNILHGTGGRSFNYNGSKIPFQVQPQLLYVPGKLIHIVKNYSFQRSKARRLFNEPIYQAIWTDNTTYDRVMISEGMFYDHLPNNLMHAMKMLFSKTLPARHDSKVSKIESIQVPDRTLHGNLNTSALGHDSIDVEDPIISDSPKEDINNNDGSNDVYRTDADENNNSGELQKIESSHRSPTQNMSGVR